MVIVEFSYNGIPVSAVDSQQDTLLGDIVRYAYNYLLRNNITDNRITTIRVDYPDYQSSDLDLLSTLGELFGAPSILYVNLVDDGENQERTAMYQRYVDGFDSFKRWRSDSPTKDLCMRMKAPSLELVAILRQILSKRQKLLVVVHYGDAVKNFANNTEQYNVLDVNFKFRDYENKASFLRNTNNDDVRKVDLKLWSRQQWIYNTLRYASLHQYHVLYIQADLTYCRYPSMFAEAMMGDLYTRVIPIRNMGWHLTGENQDLFCIGDYSIANALLRQIPSSIPILTDDMETGIGGDVEWMNMDNQYLNSFYQSQIQRQPTPSYLRYPLDLICRNITANPNLTVHPVNVEILQMMGPLIRGRATYVTDLRSLIPNWSPLAIYSIDNYKVQPSADLPLVYLLGPTGGKVIYLLALGNSAATRYVRHQDVVISGTINRPLIQCQDAIIDLASIVDIR